MVVFNLFCLHVVLFDFLPWAFRCKMVLLLFTCVRLTELSCCYREMFPHNRRMLAWWRRMVKLTWRRRQACGRALCSLLVSYLTLPTPPPHHHHHPPTPKQWLLLHPCFPQFCFWVCHAFEACVFDGVSFFFLFLLPLPPFFLFLFFSFFIFSSLYCTASLTFICRGIGLDFSEMGRVSGFISEVYLHEEE